MAGIFDEKTHMPTYLIGQITVTNPTLWQEYVTGVAESIAPYNASIVFRGKRSQVLAGETYPKYLA